MKCFFMLSLIGLTLLAGCAPSNVKTLLADKKGAQLSPARVLALVEGNTLKLSGGDSEVYLYMDTSGKAFAVDVTANKDIGQWDVSEDGEFCVRMHDWWFSDLICYQIYEVGDEYKLTDSRGLIKFSALQYEGDYKHIFYLTKRDRKSFRKSFRKSHHSAKRKSREAASGSSLAGEAADGHQEPGKAITEANTFTVSREDRNLRSTVKWMARDCPGCNLAETDLKKADLVGAHLNGANLRGANLRMANLRRAQLEGANLEDAILTYCNMPGANLKNANLKGANLKGANLIRADLSNADLTGATLDGALLEGVKGLHR